LQQEFLDRFNRSYEWTAYEKAIKFYHQANADSCLHYLYLAIDENPRSKSALMLLANYYLNRSELDKGFRIFEQLISYYPRDFSLYMESGSYRYSMYLLSEDYKMLDEANRLFKKAVILNPYCAVEVDQLKRQADSLLKKE
jgi:tetratricopeptide (TPR) repeat protein